MLALGIARFKRQWLWVLLGLGIGATLGPANELLLAPYYAWQNNKPVASMRGNLVEYSGQRAVVHIMGEKLRDCTYKLIYGAAVVSGVNFDLIPKRLDAPITGSTKVLGVWDIGQWEYTNIPTEATELNTYVQHECKDVRGTGAVVTVVTLIASVKLGSAS